MTAVPLPTPAVRCRDGYGHARMPRGTAVPEPERIDRVEYGRFRNVYLYITEACQLRCEHCYMGGRLDRALKMPLPEIAATLTAWRRMGGSKLTILGGEPTLHPGYTDAVRLAGRIGYEHVITTTNAQVPALRKFRILSHVAPYCKARVWYQPTYARRDQMERYAAEGYQGCIGRTLDRISVFPDGRGYVCSYLFDTSLHFARMDNGQVKLNRGDNEFDLFTKPLTASACGGCKAPACLGGCPAEEVITGGSSCAAYEDIVPVCRLWKSSAKPEERR